MPITFEPIKKSFERLPNDYQKLVTEYLVGKEFNSLEEALSQEYEPGRSLEWHGFRVEKLRLTPKNLPEEINKAVIGVRISEEGEPQARISYIPVLIARYSE